MADEVDVQQSPCLREAGVELGRMRVTNASAGVTAGGPVQRMNRMAERSRERLGVECGLHPSPRSELEGVV